MNAMKRPLGSHKHLWLVVCDRCGHKEPWSSGGFDAMREHIAAHLAAEAVAREAAQA